MVNPAGVSTGYYVVVVRTLRTSTIASPHLTLHSTQAMLNFDLLKTDQQRIPLKYP